MLRIGTLKRKGQLTVPADIRAALGLEEGDAVEFELEDATVRLRARKGDPVERTKGAIRSRIAPMTAEELRAAAEIARAEDVIERSLG